MRNIHYWNKDNFQSLQSIADNLRSEPRFKRLVDYCESREQGKRTEAFQALDEFLQMANTWQDHIRQQMVSRVLSTHYAFPSAHHFLAQPLVKKFIDPVLDNWRRKSPDAQEPVRWLGLLNSDDELLEASLNQNPNDELVRGVLVQLYLQRVDYATHHLIESRFLGDEKDALSVLHSVARLLQSAPKSDSLKHLSTWFDELQSLVEDWIAYKKGTRGSFPDWCKERNRQYEWPTIVYYKNDRKTT